MKGWLHRNLAGPTRVPMSPGEGGTGGGGGRKRKEERREICII